MPKPATETTSLTQVSREEFARDSAKYVRAADKGPIAVVDTNGATRMVLSTLRLPDDAGYLAK